MQQLQPMIDASKPDELMIIGAIYDHEARKKSYSLLAEAFGLREQGGGQCTSIRRCEASSESGFRVGFDIRDSFHLLAEGRAERMRRVDAEDAEFAREEFQLLERELEALSSGWPSTSA